MPKMESQPAEIDRTKESNGEGAKKLTPSPRNEEVDLSDSDGDSIPEIECDLCSKTFQSVQTYEQHLNSKRHHQMITKRKLMKKAVKDASKEEPSDPSNGASYESDSTELYCDVCDKTVSGYVPYRAHLKGSTHAKNLKQNKLKETLKDTPEVLGAKGVDHESDNDGIFQKPYATCPTCQKTFLGPESLHQHMKGSCHKKKMQQMKTLESLKDDKSEIDGEDDEFFTQCEVCNKSFSGPVPYTIHLKSSVHQKAVKRNQAEEEMKDLFLKDSSNLVCKECKKTFSDPFSFKLHLDNNSHAKQKVKDEMFDFISSNPEIVVVKAIQSLSSDEEDDENANYQPGSHFLVCKICHFSFSGPKNALSHVKSKKHLKVKKEKAEIKLIKQQQSDKKNEGKFQNGNDIRTPDNSSVVTKKSLSNGNKVTTTNVAQSKNDNIDDFELI